MIFFLNYLVRHLYVAVVMQINYYYYYPVAQELKMKFYSSRNSKNLWAPVKIRWPSQF